MYVSDAVSSSPIARPGAAMETPADAGVDTAHSPWLRSWWSPQNHHTVHRAAGCVSCDCFTYTQQLFIEKPLMEKTAKLNAPLFSTHIRWTSRSTNGMCSVDPECTQHSRIPKSEEPVMVDLVTKTAKELVVEPPATVGLSLCSQLLFMMSFSTLPCALNRDW